MPFELRYHPVVKAFDIPRLDRLMTAPHDYGMPLRKNLKGYWKLRVGDYRVVFKIAGSEVFIFCIRHRKDVYGVMSERISRHT
jgi:mRNA interferase RelE/StbE